MITFVVAIFLLLLTPGPGVLSTAGVGSGFGFNAGYRYVTGLCIGTNLVALAVVSGVAGIMFSIPVLRQILLVLSVLYLIYLASRIAFSGSRVAFISSQTAPGLLNGIALQIINPKAYAVNATLFTGFAFGGDNLMFETIIKFLIINAIWIPIHFLWLGAGVSLKKMALEENKQRIINYCMAASLLVVAALALLVSPGK